MVEIDLFDRKEFIIKSIITVYNYDELMELYFNCINKKVETSFRLSISDDGESIQFLKKEELQVLGDISYTAFQKQKINYKDDLYRLIDNEIKLIRFGVGSDLITNNEVIYYFMMATDKNEFLFFNNGDKGEYIFSELDLVLSEDIYMNIHG